MFVVLLLSSTAVVLDDLRLFAVLLGLALLVVAVFQGDVGVLYRLRKILAVLFPLIVIQSVFTGGGEPLLSVGGMPLITTVGLQRGGGLVFRIAVIILASSILMKEPSRRIIQGLIQCRVPYEIAFMVHLAIRFLPLLQEELQDAFTAVQLRGVELDRLPLRRRLYVYTHLFLPILAGVVGKAREISTAMEMKAFRAVPKRTSHMQLCFGRRDYLAMGVSVLLLAGLAGMGTI